MHPTLIALSYAFCWGIGVTLTKIALSEIRPTTLLITQLLASVTFLATLCYLKDHTFPFSRRSFKQGVAGIFEPALAYIFGIFGIEMTTASNAVLIASSEVILTILCASFFLGEKLTPTKLMLAIISFLGVSLLMLKDAQGASHSSLTGDVLVLIDTCFAVCYVLVSKKQITTTSPLQLTASQQWVGLIVTVLSFGILSIFNHNYAINTAGISLSFWGLAIASGIMQYGLAFWLYLTALQTVSTSQAAFYVALVPVFGVASAILLIGEKPSVAQWLGASLVIGTSYWANRSGAIAKSRQ
jgi:drug/metabolite transporter (DMT)-like permease